jgi:hypothetical protein
LYIKGNNYQNEATAYRIGENICQLLREKGLISRIYKELKKLIRANNPSNKWINELNKHFSNGEIQIANKIKI